MIKFVGNIRFLIYALRPLTSVRLKTKKAFYVIEHLGNGTESVYDLQYRIYRSDRNGNKLSILDKKLDHIEAETITTISV